MTSYVHMNNVENFFMSVALEQNLLLGETVWIEDQHILGQQQLCW